MSPQNGSDHLSDHLPFEGRWAVGGPSDFVRETDRSEGGPDHVADWAVCAALVERPTDRLEFGPISRKVRLWRDPRCGMVVLRGLDGDRCALTATVDPYPLSPIGEVAALALGRRTYYLARGELNLRDRWNIPGHLPSHDLLVLVTHDCTAMHTDWLLPPAPRTPAPPAPAEVRF